MALSILDGNQSATTLSTILTSGQHIPAHTVVSLGTQAITDMRGAVSGSVVSISNFPATQPVSIASVTIGNSVTIGSLPAISGTVTVANFPATQTIAGTVTANAGDNFTSSIAGGILSFQENDGFTINVLPALPTGTNSIGSVTVGGGFISLTTGTSRIGVVTVGNSVTIGAGTVTIGAGTAQIGSVTASISGTVPISISSVTVGNSVTIGSLPAISGTVTVGNSVTISSLPSLVAGTANIGVVTIGNIRRSGDGALSQLSTEIGSGALQTVIGSGTSQIGSVTASISNSVVTFYPMQGTSVSNTNFTSITASTTLVSAVAGREVLTVFNEGAGNLHISPGATCTTVAYQVRLSAGDYWECPQGQLSLAHTAVFATAGTARVCQVS